MISQHENLGWCSRIDWGWFLSGLKPPTTKCLLPRRVWLIDGSGSTFFFGPNSGRADSTSHKISGSNLLPGFLRSRLLEVDNGHFTIYEQDTSAVKPAKNMNIKSPQWLLNGWSIATQSPESMSRRIIQTFVDQSLDCSGWPRSQKLVATGTTSWMDGKQRWDKHNFWMVNARKCWNGGSSKPGILRESS